MTGTERIKAVLEGKKPDRVPVSLWKHVPIVDRDIKRFTEKTIELTDTDDYDFVKIQVSAAYLTEAYGADIEFNDKEDTDFSGYLTNPQITMFKIIKYPIESAEDIKKIKPIDVRNSKVLQRDHEVFKNVLEYYHGTKPVLFTLFNALTWLQYFSRNGAAGTVQYLVENKEEVHQFLRNINDVNKQLVDWYVELGIDGFFFADRFTTDSIITESAFNEFVRPYDLEILNYIHEKKSAWFNILHIHGNADLNINHYLDYPVEAINWEDIADGVDSDKLISAKKLRSLTDKVLIGGIDRFVDFNGTQEEVKEKLKKRLEDFAGQFSDNKFVFGGGCSLPIDVNERNVSKIREVVNEFKY